MDPLQTQLEEAMKEVVAFTDEQKAGIRQRCRGYTGRERDYCLIININATVERRRQAHQVEAERRARYEAEIQRKRERVKAIREEQAAARGKAVKPKGPPKPTERPPSEQRPDIATRRQNLLGRRTGVRGNTYQDVCNDIARQNQTRRELGQQLLNVPWFCEDLETAVRGERAREQVILSNARERARQSQPPAMRQRTAGEQLEIERLRSGFVYHGAGAPSTRRG